MADYAWDRGQLMPGWVNSRTSELLLLAGLPVQGRKEPVPRRVGRAGAAASGGDHGNEVQDNWGMVGCRIARRVGRGRRRRRAGTRWSRDAIPVGRALRTGRHGRT